ncbi:MFS general substrate transporter [Xylona heveae TC161]|uniref:MFS general substrate transporter n=1 Tax=Xylona heveae (strain CBS 132557 / TC161) TaxID=1328760 RepID=A0A165FL95_XYLHT|nr:MFS general substrate transporter [Xylona heveae TC161]KZF21109.1 MFS general substrate transporter [Xylona heveae TC161]
MRLEEERGEAPNPSPSGPPPAPKLSLLHEIAFVAIICSAQLMTQAGLGQIIATQYIVGKDFGITNPGLLSWFSASYSLTVGTFILIAGRLGDMYGHRLMFCSGFIWFALWSLIAGLSVYSGHVLFNFCRAMQGIGPAFILPNGLALLGRFYPPGPRKGMVFGMFGATAPNGFIVGAVFGSLFSQLAWWPWTYYSFAIACVGLSIGGYLIIPTMESSAADNVHRRAGFDWAGSITGVTGLVLVNFAWNQGPAYGWDKPYVYILLIIGLIILGLFVFIELRAAQPLVPLHSLSGETGYVLACVAAGWSSFGIWIYYMFRFMLVTRHLTPLNAAAQMTPAGISGLLASMTTGFLIHKVPVARLMVVAMIAFCVGLILISTAPVHQTYWAQWFVAILVTPWGMDISFPASTIMLSNFVSHEHQGIAASLVATVVNYSISIGLGIAGTVEVQVAGGDPLKGFRCATWTGIGLAGMGIVISIIFAVRMSMKSSHEAKMQKMHAEHAARADAFSAHSEMTHSRTGSVQEKDNFDDVELQQHPATRQPRMPPATYIRSGGSAGSHPSRI